MEEAFCAELVSLSLSNLCTHLRIIALSNL